MKTSKLTIAAFVILAPALALAQAPPSYPPQELDNLVARIALYPDPLLSQVLAGATYPQDIPDAARWAGEHSYLHGDQLAGAIQADQLPWDPSVQALLPFPSVLDMMARDMNWTTEIGNAFLAEPNAVMDSVQRKRQEALNFGYLRSNGQISVIANGGYVQILPVNPAVIPVPIYSPGVVYVRPRAGFFVGGAIRFGGVTLGTAFAPWGWGHDRFDWGAHRVIINDHPWERSWVNRREYVHPYVNVHRYDRSRRPVERHDFRSRGRRDDHDRDHHDDHDRR